jgi:hypothetical protein
MRPFGVTLAVSLALVATAQAATLTIVSDKPTYAVGDTITLSVRGDSQGGTAFGIFGRLLYSPALAQTVTSSQQPLTAAGVDWIQGLLLTGDGFADVFNQITPVPGPEPAAADNLLIAQVALTAEARGIVNVVWSETDGFALDFFGLTTAPGTSFFIVGCATDADCNDDDACTQDTCTNAVCANTPIDGCAFADSDGDGTSDSKEMMQGTDPNDPASNGATYVGRVVADEIPVRAFRSRGGRTALLARLADVEARIAYGDRATPITKLLLIRRKLDGCEMSPSKADRNDWIKTCAAQDEVRQLIDGLIADLRS